MKTVLASVYDKTGLVEFLSALQQIEPLRIVATGSTASFLQEAGLTCDTVESVTGFPEILEGRVKTLHPKVFGGILAKDSSLHQEHLSTHQIPTFDYVIVNLYPFEAVVKSGADEAKVIENIDIGGVALIRAAAKNFNYVTVAPGPEFYSSILDELQNNQGKLSTEFKKQLARRTFEISSTYDSMIAAYLLGSEAEELPNTLCLKYAKIQDLRYGENPHQQAAWYQQADASAQTPFTQVQGKEMSSNNIVDAYSAYNLIREFPKNPAACIIKHNNPCGVAIGSTIQEALEKAYNSDPTSAFGGVFGLNQTVTGEMAEFITRNFVEIVMAPSFSPEALDVFSKKKNVRLLEVPGITQPKDNKASWVMKDLNDFGIIIQENTLNPELPELTNVTQQPLADSIFSDVSFGWAIVKHLTSNAIVVVKDGQTVGMGIGQTSRIASVEIALKQAGEKAKGAVLASDGFFPASDNIEAAAQAGISVIIQPGGSIKDPEVIEAADQHGLVMVMTHERCFKH